ncbi:hypothetical protein ZWY2020_039775 [Hordeum vulgare]|nr:hypothetical protein ZWY2020_039775 [Hordeum vulgare]
MATAEDEKMVVVLAREDGGHLGGARARMRGLVGGGDNYGRAGG